jgi:hypothetical protein
MLFLATTVVTSATGFLFPLKRVTPALAVGVLSLCCSRDAVAGVQVQVASIPLPPLI